MTSNYSPIGDLTIISICYVIIILLIFSYVRKNRSYKIFVVIIGFLMASAIADVASYSLMKSPNPTAGEWAYVMRCVFHALLFFLFVLFAIYICEVARLEQKRRRIFRTIAIILYALVVILDVYTTISGRLSLTGAGAVREGQNIFAYGYCAFLALMLVMLITIRHRVYRRVMLGFYGSIAISFLILLVQGLMRDSSYTVATFFYPVLAMFYSMHSNPYDALLGAADGTTFSAFVGDVFRRGQSFIYMSFYLKLFREEDFVVPEALQASIRQHSVSTFRHSLLFQPERGHLILAAVKEQNPDYHQKIMKALEDFQKEYQTYQYDCKLLVGESVDEISSDSGYLDFFQHVRETMEENEIHFVNETDVAMYQRDNAIRKELEDIYKQHNLDDPRVLVYCQPVYNVVKGTYETAEALMRLQLEEEIIPPNEFIPIAESSGYIHVLTEIILHKTCEMVKYFCEQGYIISRISVNVSALELKDPNFSQDLIRIIWQSRVPDNKIAIELTESQTYSDFLLMKERIEELKDKGIIFYLDDFGTGYSSMERIMEIPFDIIKFDRSLVIASRSSDRSHKLVVGMSNIFSSMNYAVLYEGIEEAEDEQMCIGMSASYLQGYKYSKPIPIMELQSYLTRQE